MTLVANCRDCFARDECGGWTLSDNGEPLITCFEAFGSSKKLFIDPTRRRDFMQRLAEVKYFRPIHPQKFCEAKLSSFPDYLTLVQGGVCFNRPLNLTHAGLNLVEIFHGDKFRGLAFGQRTLTAESLRAEWGLKPETELLLSGVADDPELERLSSNYRLRDIASQLAELRVAAVTAPNFTFWKNAPLLENLINRRRMFRIAEALSDKGVSAIPHLNSTNPKDWDWMAAFYREHPELDAVCMEFRTGNRIKEVRQRKIASLVQLRDLIGRELRPIIVGNIEAAREVRAHFPNVTAVDSTPALKTIRRQQAIQRIGPSLGWRKEPLASGACMADLFESNFTEHSTHVMKRFALPVETPEDTAKTASPRRILRATNRSLQGELPLEAA